MNMTVKLLVFGGMIILASILFVVVLLPWWTVSEKPSEIFRSRSALEDRGAGSIYRERLHLLPHSICPLHRLGYRRRTDRPNG